MAWFLKDTIEPDFDGGLIDNKFIKAGMFNVKTREQRNTVIKTLYRQLDGSTTTLCFVSADRAIYELIANPSTEGTTDQDWERLDFGVSDILIAKGSWDADNTTPVLQDTGAIGNGNDFYIVTGAAVPVSVQHTGLFQGQLTEVVDGDWIISNGEFWFVSPSPIGWDSISGRPTVIDEYVAGTVIAHPHEMTEINGLIAALDLKFDVGDVADNNIPYSLVPNEKLINKLVLDANFYTKEIVDTLLLLSDSSGGDIDFNRPIKKLPVVGQTPGGTKVIDGLEEIYYGIVKPTLSIEAIDPQTVGDFVVLTVVGQLSSNEVSSVTKVEVVRTSDDSVIGSELILNAPPLGTAVSIVCAAQDITAGTSDQLLLRLTFVKELGDPETTLDSDLIEILGVYPMLFGMEDDLTGLEYYNNLTKLVQPKSNQKINSIAGTNQFLHFLVPLTYGIPITIRENSGDDLLDSLFPSPPTISITSDGLANNFTLDYLLFKAQYRHSFTNETLFLSYFDTTVATLDDIPVGAINKHLTSSEKQKISDIPNPGSIGDMLKSEYDFTGNGIVEYAGAFATTVRNVSGLPIPAGKLFHIVQINGGVDIILASSSSNLRANGITVTALGTNFDVDDTGDGITQGPYLPVNTIGQEVRDALYLGNNGDLLFDAPPSGTIQVVGAVGNVSVLGAIYLAPQDQGDWFSSNRDWRPLTHYDKFESFVVPSDELPGVQIGFNLLARVVIEYTSSTDITDDFNAGNIEIIAGDMFTSIYDPLGKFIDVFSMDSMDDTASKVAMLAAERTKLAGLEDPRYKGIFSTPTALRAAFNTALDGDSADVISTASTFLWDSGATPTPPTVGGDWVDSLLGVGGDMSRSVYDTLNKNADAFFMLNMDEEVGTGTAKKILTSDERVKLAGIEPAAEVNDNAAEVKVKYESNANTNPFEDADESKLDGIAPGAEVNPTDTDGLSEGATNLYFTEARANAASDVVLNTTDRHTNNANRATLDLITVAGSGIIISGAERTNIGTNNAKVSADGSIATHSNVSGVGSEGQFLVNRSGTLTPESPFLVGSAFFEGIQVQALTLTPIAQLATLTLAAANSSPNGLSIVSVGAGTNNGISHGATGVTYKCNVQVQVSLNKDTNGEEVSIYLGKNNTLVAEGFAAGLAGAVQDTTEHTKSANFTVDFDDTDDLIPFIASSPLGGTYNIKSVQISVFGYKV